MRTTIRIHPWLLVLATAACGPSVQSFQPTENVEGTTIEGLSAAFYDLTDPSGQIGSVKVWSRGAHDEGGTTVVHVGFTVDNSSDEAIVFERDATVLENIYAGDRTLQGIGPTAAAGAVVIPPRTSQDVEMAFAMPRGYEPDDIHAFRVRWSTSAASDSFTEFTPFVQYRDDAYVPIYAYYRPYDHPYYYDPFWRPHRQVIIVNPSRRVIVHGDRRRHHDHRR